jgi:hypothetical protein
MSTARQSIHALAELERLVDWGEVTKLEAALRAAIPRDAGMVTGFFAFAELVAELANQDDDYGIRQTIALAFSLAVAERLET